MDEKEVLNGYVIDVAMRIGHKRVCFGIAEDQKTEYNDNERVVQTVPQIARSRAYQKCSASFYFSRT